MSEFNVILIFVVNEKVFEEWKIECPKVNQQLCFFSFDKDAMTVSVFVTSSSQLTSYNQYFLL